MKDHSGTPLSELTTLRVGGPARRLLEAETAEEIVEVVGGADGADELLLVMGSGSNLLVADDGFPGTVVRVTSRGVRAGGTGEAARLEVAAGEPWDQVVERCVAEGLSGIECLSGIPGLTGATPIQNVGAYGQEVSETIVSVRTYDRESSSVAELRPEECGFAYRSSAFKGSARHVVLAVTFELELTDTAQPIRYPELARTLGGVLGDRPPLAEAREAVLALRRSKAMVLDPNDPDSVSAGSFFLNPLLAPRQAAELTARARQRLGDEVTVPSWPEDDGRVKISAAWLIEQAGFARGHRRGRAAISSKHTLAVVNRGGASAEEIVALARELRDGVWDAFGVVLTPEPTLVGVEL